MDVPRDTKHSMAQIWKRHKDTPITFVNLQYFCGFQVGESVKFKHHSKDLGWHSYFLNHTDTVTIRKTITTVFFLLCVFAECTDSSSEKTLCFLCAVIFKTLTRQYHPLANYCQDLLIAQLRICKIKKYI